MNLQTAHMNKKSKKKAVPVRKKQKTGIPYGEIFKMIFPLLVVFALAAIMIQFNAETEKLNRQASSLKMDIHRFDRKIAAYNIKCEELKGEYILKQIAKFNLGLHAPVPGQVKQLRFNNYRLNSKGRILLSQR